MDRRGAPEADLPAAPDNKTSFSVPLDQKGYFHIFGAAQGKYVLAVECPTGSSVRELQVHTGKGIRIAPPLRLEDLTFEIAVTPKLDPEGKPWRLTIDATMPRLRRIASKAATSVEGRWMQSGLSAGNYRVNVSSSDGTPWLQRFFDLRVGSTPLSLHLPFMRVQGEVQLNSQPVRARLTFHNDAGGEPTTLTSDDGGFFEGLLPITPDSQETQWTVEARGVTPPISRRLSGVRVHSADGTTAWLDLVLPVFAVHGTVVSEKGHLQSGVQVNFENNSSGTRSSTATDDSGGFELSSLPPGEYTAWAESLDGASERVPLQVAESSESELQLVLKPFQHMPFYVVSRDRPVADAAVQVWTSPGVPRYFTRTDADGRFEVRLPPGTTEIGLTVGAPGFALKLTRLKISSDGENSASANTISLDESVGTLVLDLQPSRHAPGRLATPYLVHDGAIEAVGTLADWGSEQTYARDDDHMVVKAIEPGAYALCFVTDPAELSTLWLGVLPDGRCRTGSVQEHETLTLSPY